MVVGARQNFQFFRQKASFLGKIFLPNLFDKRNLPVIQDKFFLSLLIKRWRVFLQNNEVRLLNKTVSKKEKREFSAK